MLRNFFLIYVFLDFILFCQFSFGSDFENQYERKHSLGFGIDFAFSRGDFNGKSINSGENTESETVILQKIPNFMAYTLDAAVMFDAHSIGLNAGLGFPSEDRYLRLSLEYQYRFFWREPLQFGIGGGYAFTSIQFAKAAFGEASTERSYANFTGNGAFLVVSSDYYLNKNLSLELGMRCFFLSLDKVATKLNKFSKLSHALWQIMGMPGLKLKFVF